MRPFPAVRRAAPAAVLLVAACLSAGCSVLGADESAPEEAARSEEPRDPGTRACAEVRAGVDAFNAGDFEETVQRFQAAVPLAEERAEQYPSRRADLLLEAVRWYADLPPGDYPEASRESEKFARYKAITLAQCVVGVPGDGESSGGVRV